jgi:hypothetical protein
MIEVKIDLRVGGVICEVGGVFCGGGIRQVQKIHSFVFH